MREVSIEESGKFLDPQATPRVDSSRLAGWSGRPELMGAAHQHDDLELNLVAEGGAMLYLFAGVPVEVGPGSITAFWAAVPHQLVANEATRVHWVHVPFGTFLGWGLPTPLVSRLLSGTPIVSRTPGTLAADAAHFEQWSADLASDHPERLRIAMLEMEARVRRLALTALDRPLPEYSGGDTSLRQVITMVRHIAEHFREPLATSDIAGAARLNPQYAMTRFRKVMRTTMGDYLTRCRLAEARRLLVSTDLPISRVALDAGFGSSSRFYSVFTAHGGLPPAAFRRTHQRT
jgi:AraC-like DNA-binding protein